ncbi:DUF1569 domain-containing protein [Lacinutrix sp. 5H-3-7-4]|uniref:DUF1569 domain-containing protein n=1 Tax=Lacinutrix sp. (strain 5H-3-7-4) TaxID=983544 RepID=UPI00020A36E4|nr:DUF1569 domain-containing protein [Lacinutrix sp. 5H-3-7-4]AEH00285.1 hypothetical protein Lacal_0433 [Lacinutrix sp. 5H-3-7-4]
MESIFNTQTVNSIFDRIEKLDKNTPAIWGKMDAAQMLNHCQAPINVMLQKKDYGLKSNWFMKLLIKKSLYSDKPYRKNLPTVPAFKVQTSKSFKTEKKELIELIQELYSQKSKNTWQPHPVFGHYTNEQWAMLQYKHLDHHLKQFGV